MRSTPALACAAGVGVFALGLLYGVLTVEVPTLDPEPGVAAHEARDAAVAEVIMVSGLGLSTVGVMGFVARGVVRVARRFRRGA